MSSSTLFDWLSVIFNLFKFISKLISSVVNYGNFALVPAWVKLPLEGLPAYPAVHQASSSPLPHLFVCRAPLQE